MRIYLREIETKDLEDYYTLNHPSQRHHQFNGPYFEQETEDDLKETVQQIADRLAKSELGLPDNQMIVELGSEQLMGSVGWYWKSKETLWLEVGVLIFNDTYWGQGIATQALRLWIDKVFAMQPTIVRIGFTTWSGNIGMCKVGEKLGMSQEACYRKARIVNGEYYDSVSYGILRDEWQTTTA